MSRIAIMQPYIFPYLGYFQLVRAVDTFVFFDDVQFKRRSYITRNAILGDDGPMQFSVPVQKGNRDDAINVIRLHQGEYGQWKDKFLKTLTHAYASAPYFEEAFPLVEEVFGYPREHISILVERSINAVWHYLGMEHSFVKSADLDYDRTGNGQEKILSICDRLKAKTYVNAINGRELYEKEDFQKRDIELLFLKPELKDYQQFNDDFTSHLSIIDILMFLDKEEIRNHLDNFELVTN